MNRDIPWQAQQLIDQNGSLLREVYRLQEALEASEEYRRAYQAGKYKLYAELDDDARGIAMRWLPCGEGPLDQRFRELIEMPRLRSLYKEILDLRATLGEAIEHIHLGHDDNDYMTCDQETCRQFREAFR